MRWTCSKFTKASVDNLIHIHNSSCWKQNIGPCAVRYCISEASEGTAFGSKPSTPNCLGSLFGVTIVADWAHLDREIAFFIEVARTCEAGRRRMQQCYCNAQNRSRVAWKEALCFITSRKTTKKFLNKPDHNGLWCLNFDYLARITEAKNYLSIDLHDEVEESDDVPFSGMKPGAPSWICVDLSYLTMKLDLLNFSKKSEFAFVSSLFLLCLFFISSLFVLCLLDLTSSE